MSSGGDRGAGPVEVRPAFGADLVLLANLYPLYLHDLTAFTDFYDVDAEGRFVPDYITEWLSRRSPAMHPFTFHEGGRPAGFALVAQRPYPFMGQSRDYRMCEFFVLNRARRQGVGRQAALRLFDLFQGVWEVSQLVPNAVATSFWRKVIGEHTNGAFTDAMEHGDVVQVFDSRR